MAKHTWIITYVLPDAQPTERTVEADYYDVEDGAFVTFHEDPDSGTGAGGAVLSVLAEYVGMVRRAPKR